MTKRKGVVVPAGGGQHLKESSGQAMAMKLFGRETGQSVTLFEQTVPAGSKNSWLHLHRDSDEIAWVLEGEFTFKIGDEVTTGGPGTCAFMPRNVPHAWKNSGSTPGRVVFLYTPAGAGKFVDDGRRDDRDIECFPALNALFQGPSGVIVDDHLGPRLLLEIAHHRQHDLFEGARGEHPDLGSRGCRREVNSAQGRSDYNGAPDMRFHRAILPDEDIIYTN